MPDAGCRMPVCSGTVTSPIDGADPHSQLLLVPALHLPLAAKYESANDPYALRIYDKP